MKKINVKIAIVNKDGRSYRDMQGYELNGKVGDYTFAVVRPIADKTGKWWSIINIETGYQVVTAWFPNRKSCQAWLDELDGTLSLTIIDRLNKIIKGV